MQSSNFVKEKRLGSGAFGVVYRVRSIRSSKLYVIKEQELNSTTDKKIVMNEIEVLRQLPRHQNVIAYLGSWAENGKGCILMEYASRGSLYDVLKGRTGPMSEEDAVFLFSQIVLGVNHIHRHSVIHRDLKPANVMMHRVSDEYGIFMDIIKIGDFGISKDTRGSVAKTAIGTKIYMAPEMFHGSGYGYKCDMWSCGIILYELLTNKFPFSADTMEEMMRKIQRGRATPITSGNISRSLVTLTSKLMSVDPDERPRSTHLVRHPAIDRCNENIRNYLHTNSHRSTALQSHSIGSGVQEFLRSLASSRR